MRDLPRLLQVLRALVLGQPESEEDRAECREGRNITSTGAYCTVLLESQKFPSCNRLWARRNETWSYMESTWQTNLLRTWSFIATLLGHPCKTEPQQPYPRLDVARAHWQVQSTRGEFHLYTKILQVTYSMLCSVHFGGLYTVAVNQLRFNEELAEGICKIVDPTDTIVDLGARIGMYTRYFRERSCVRLALAYDGGIGVREMSSGLVQHLDLTQLHNIGVFDWVLSLEVAEHIPPEYESVYIENLHRHNRKGIIMSWAFPGQSGVGHVNEQHAPQVRLMFKELGYLFDPRATRRLRSTCHSHLSYFMNTLLVFRRNTTFH